VTRDASGAAVRDAAASDAAACAAIYAPYVIDTAITFEEQPPSPDTMAERIANAQHGHAWVVHEQDGRVDGYAYGGVFNPRPAYRWSCEVSIYLELGRRRTGAGRMLYGDLLSKLAARGYRMAVGGMTLPNEASIGLHRAMGFEPVGVFQRIGFKRGRWHDVAWMQLPLGSGAYVPDEPR
jgi:phosphinothricin acetyltransferase